MELDQLMESMKKYKIDIKIKGEANQEIGASRFGGCPDVPKDFEWPYYRGEDYNNVMANRPLSFLAQFNCEQIAQYDEEGVLPTHGVLSFFYEEASQKWGYDPQDNGCARVYWFEDIESLKRCDMPEDLEEDYRNPAIGITASKEFSYPSYEELPADCDDLTDEEFERLEEEYNLQSHQFFGWAQIIQCNIAEECELIQRGYYLGQGRQNVPKEENESVMQLAPKKWRLLFQLDEIYEEDFSFCFGDCGRLFFYITNEDLEKRNFDNVWLVYQCS